MSIHQRDFTVGPIGRQLLSFSIPFLLANALQALYGAVDMWVVGNYASVEAAERTAALSGVNIGSQVTMLVTMMVSGLTISGTVLVGQYAGACKPKEASQTVSTLFSVLFLLGAALTVIMMLCSDFILTLLHTDPAAFPYAKSYLNICMMGTLFIFGYNAISAIQRGLGDSIRPLIFVGIACVANIFLDLWFIKGFGWSAAGAALATVISQGLSFLFAAFYLSSHHFLFTFKLGSLRIYMDKLKLMLRIGVPSSLQSIITSISFLLMTALVNSIGGKDASAAVGIAAKFNSFAILPAVAMSSSVSAFSAQNIGAGLQSRARESLKMGIAIAFSLGAAVFILAQAFPSQIMSFFGLEDVAVTYGMQYMRSFTYDYLLVPLLFCLNGLLIGAGYTQFTLFTGVLSSVLLRIPVAYLLGRTSLGLFGVGLASPAATIVAALLAFWFVFTGRWMRSRTGISREKSVESPRS